MLNSQSLRSMGAPLRGFTLIEMMVSITIGLIVAAGAVSLIVAINQANSETIQSTRLTQELRSLASVISDDLKRTRRIDDPVSMVGQGTAAACPAVPKTPAQPCYRIYTGTAGCVSYGYTGTIGSASIYNYHSVRLVNGAVVLDQLTFDPNVAAGTALPINSASDSTKTDCPITGATATTLSSPQVNIIALTFLPAVVTNKIDLTVSGKFLAGDAYSNTITRTFTQPIYIRSTPAN